MQLYLAENPRTLYLLSGSRDESSGQPQRILVFRVAEGDPTQAVVEFLFKDQVDLSSAVLLTSRSVKGCLGLISIGGGMPSLVRLFAVTYLTLLLERSLPNSRNLRYRNWQHQALSKYTGICRKNTRDCILQSYFFYMG